MATKKRKPTEREKEKLRERVVWLRDWAEQLEYNLKHLSGSVKAAEGSRKFFNSKDNQGKKKGLKRLIDPSEIILKEILGNSNRSSLALKREIKKTKERVVILEQRLRIMQ